MKHNLKTGHEPSDRRPRKTAARRKKAAPPQEDIGELNSRLAAIVESSDDAIIGKDLDGIITSWNKGAEKIYGYRADEVINRPVSILIPPGHAEEMSSILDKIGNGESVAHYETVRMTRDAGLITISLTVSPVMDSSGAIIGASSISRDISRRKEREETLQRQAQVLNQIQDAVITTDLDGIVTGWNRGAEKIYLYKAEEAVGRHISFIYPEDQLQFLRHGVIVPLKEKGEYETEVRLRKKSGEEFFALLLLSLLRDAAGAAIGMVGSSVDISARKEAEERIRIDNEEWVQTFDAMPDIVAVIDSQHIIRRANKALTARLGIPRDELIGRYCHASICGSERPSADCPGTRALLTGKEHIEERFVERLGGHYLVSCTPIFSADGRIVSSVEVYRDISERAEMEKKLQEAANTDQLTGLFNRRGFLTLAEHQLRVADREKRRMMFLYLDLDGMKAINDNFGHREGDRALTASANLLKKTFRESDIIGRIGGDEFAVLMTQPSRGDIEQVMCEHIKNNLESYNSQSGSPYLVSLSMGIAHYDPENPCTLDDLMAVADSIMYRNKRYPRT